MGIGVAFAQGVVGELLEIDREKRQAKAKFLEDESALKIFKKQEEIKSGIRTKEAETTAKATAAATADNDRLNRMLEVYKSLDKALQPQFLIDNPEFSRSMGFAMTPEFANLANSLTDTDTTTLMGNEKLPFKIDFSKKEDVLGGIGSFEEYLVKNQSRIDELLETDENFKKDFEAYSTNLFNRFNNVFFKEYSGVGEDGTVTTPAYANYKKRAPTFRKYLLQFGLVGSKNFNNIPDNVPEGNVALMLPSNLEDPAQPDYEVGVVTMEAVTEQLNVSKNSLDALAAYHGMPQGAGQVFANLDYMAYGQDPEAAVRAVAGGARLVGINAPDLVLIEGGASNTTLTATANEFTSIGGGSADKGYANEDTGAMVRAAYTVIKPNPVEEAMPTIEKANVTGVQYAISQKYDVDGFREQRAAQQESVALLGWLKSNQQKLGVTGFSKGLVSIGVGLVAQGQQLYDIFIGPDSEQTNADFTSRLAKGTDANMLMSTARNALGIGTDVLLSEIDALKITLAAKLARAVDPSGRLSNQDFEMQLKRIGQEGLLTSMAGSLAALDTVTAEMNARIKDGDLLDSIIKKETIKAEDRRFIKAHKMVQTALVHRNRMRNATTPVPERNENQQKPTVAIKPGDYVGLEGVTIGGRPVAIRVDGEGPQYIYTDDNTSVEPNPEFDSLEKGQN